MGLGTHIYDLSVGSGRLELKEDDVEDRHRVGGSVEEVVIASVQYPRVAICIFSIVQQCISPVPSCGLRLIVLMFADDVERTCCLQLKLPNAECFRLKVMFGE